MRTKMSNRLDRLEHEYRSKSESHFDTTFTVMEFEFMFAFEQKYRGHKNSAPLILRDAYYPLAMRWARRRLTQPAGRMPEQSEDPAGVAAGTSSRHGDPRGEREEKS